MFKQPLSDEEIDVFCSKCEQEDYINERMEELEQRQMLIETNQIEQKELVNYAIHDLLYSIYLFTCAESNFELTNFDFKAFGKDIIHQIFNSSDLYITFNLNIKVDEEESEYVMQLKKPLTLSDNILLKKIIQSTDIKDTDNFVQLQYDLPGYIIMSKKIGGKLMKMNDIQNYNISKILFLLFLTPVLYAIYTVYIQLLGYYSTKKKNTQTLTV